MSSELFDPIRTMAKVTREVLVGFSGGKDSCVALDICFRYFEKVRPFFMYQVPRLSFQEKTIQIYEKKYGVEILRIPHFETSNFLRYGLYRTPDYEVPIVSTSETYDYLRSITGVYWIVGGERISDSIVRRAMLKRSGSIDFKRGRFFPLAYWNKSDVLNYIGAKKLYVGEESRKLGFSFRSLDGKSLAMLKEYYPQDLDKVKKIYPFCDAAIIREEQYGNQQISSV